MTSPAAPPRPDIASRDHVSALVVAFYGRAFKDELLRPIFVDVAHLDLAAHLPIMCDFWETVLFKTGAYKRNALQAHTALHARSPLNARHFGRWLDIWTATVDAMFAGEKAELAKVQAARIAWSMSRRLMGESGSEFVTIRRASDTDYSKPQN